MDAEQSEKHGHSTHQGYENLEEGNSAPQEEVLTYDQETTESIEVHHEVGSSAHSEFDNGSGVQAYEGTTETYDEGFGGSGDHASIVYSSPEDSQLNGKMTDFDALAEQVQDCVVTEAACSRVKVAVTFSPVLFLGEDLYQQKRIRSMIYRYDDSYFCPLDVEDVYLDMKVLVVDDDGVDFQRAIVSGITRVGISVDRLDYFGIKEVATVYECPEEIQEEPPAVRKYSLREPPKKDPLLRGQRLNLICDFSDRDFVEAEIIE